VKGLWPSEGGWILPCHLGSCDTLLHPSLAFGGTEGPLLLAPFMPHLLVRTLDSGVPMIDLLQAPILGFDSAWH
jgi:hypothetical protein